MQYPEVLEIKNRNQPTQLRWKEMGVIKEALPGRGEPAADGRDLPSGGAVCGVSLVRPTTGIQLRWESEVASADQPPRGEKSIRPRADDGFSIFKAASWDGLYGGGQTLH